MNPQEKVMSLLANFVSKYHKIIPIAAVVLFILSVFAARNIQVKTQMKDMLPEDNPQAQSLVEINDHFSGGTSLLITIEGTDKAEMAACAEMFAQEVKKNDKVMKYIKVIDLKLDRDFITKWGFLLQKERDLKRSRKIFSALNLLPFITSLNDSFEETYTGDEAEEEIATNKQETEAVAMLNQLEMFVILLRYYIENPDSEPVEIQGRKLAETFMYGDSYAYSTDNTMLMFSITPNISVDDIEAMIDMMAGIKEIRSRVQAQFPNLTIGYTGEVAMGADEQEAVGFDMLVPALVALGIILVLFIFSFNQLRAIVFAAITLVMGIVFTYGFVGITIKEITMITSFMAVLLIGLGIDYGIQIVTNFTMYRQGGFDPKDALELTYRKAGMGILLAALTTAVAFFVMAATGSKAFSQFGIIAGTGIILCFLSMIFILPSMLLWFGKKDVSHFRIPNINYGFIYKLGIFAHRNRRVTFITGLIVTGGLIAAAFLNRFEYDFMKLEPQHMTSFVTYEKVMEKYEINPLSSMVIAEDVDEARKLTRVLEKKSAVAEVHSISQYLPSEQEQEVRLSEIRKIRNMPKRYDPEYSYTADDMDPFIYEIQRLEWNVIEIGDLSVAGLGENNKIIEKRSSMIREIFGAEVGRPGDEVFQKLIQLIEAEPALYAGRLSRLDIHFAKELDRIVSKMAKVDNKITINELPESVKNRHLDEKGERNLVIIYPKKGAADDRTSMQRFNATLNGISPKITGWSHLALSWMEEAFTESKKAAIYIFIVVFVVMVLCFRSLLYSLLASVPLIIGMIWMLGLYPLFRLKINVMNIVVIPVVIGMGVDFGCHIVHRFIVEGDISTVYRFTGKAVFLSALTTMIGFGSLGLIGSFPSIASIGTILFMGIATCLTAALVILPSLLVLEKSKKRS